MRIPEDMRFFKKKTTGKVVVMGRKTLESFPGSKPLKDRENVVLSTQLNFSAGGAKLVNSMFELFKLLGEYEDKDIFVIGGGSIYKQLLPFCDTAYITKIDAVFDADTAIPNLDEDPEWRLSSQKKGGEHQGIEFSFCTYKRRKEKDC